MCKALVQGEKEICTPEMLLYQPVHYLKLGNHRKARAYVSLFLRKPQLTVQMWRCKLPLEELLLLQKFLDQEESCRLLQAWCAFGLRQWKYLVSFCDIQHPAVRAFCCVGFWYEKNYEASIACGNNVEDRIEFVCRYLARSHLAKGEEKKARALLSLYPYNSDLLHSNVYTGRLENALLEAVCGNVEQAKTLFQRVPPENPSFDWHSTVELVLSILTNPCKNQLPLFQ